MSRNKRTSIFDTIYRENSWQDPDSRSGTGSNLVQTATIRKAIPDLINQYKVKSMLDVPCGDFFWMKEIKEELRKKLDHYYGGDIVGELVQQNNQRYADEQFTFLQLDIINDKIPQVDLIFCRDCLVHLSYEDTLKAIQQFKKSGSTYLLTTTFTEDRLNKNIKTVDWRPLNLLSAPFYFPKPLLVINENCTEDNGIYDAWNKALSITRGRWVSFVGADDFFWNNKVFEELIPHLEVADKNGIKFVYGKVNQLSPDNNKIIKTLGEP